MPLGSYFWASSSVLCPQGFTCTGSYFCVPRVSHWARDLEWGSALTKAGRGPSLFAKVLLLVLLFLQNETKTKTNTKIRNQRQGAISLCQGSACPCPKNAENIFGGNLLADLGGTPPPSPFTEKNPFFKWNTKLKLRQKLRWRKKQSQRLSFVAKSPIIVLFDFIYGI